jgi:hypothetical protein
VVSGKHGRPRGCHECATHKEHVRTVLVGWLTEEGMIGGGATRHGALVDGRWRRVVHELCRGTVCLQSLLMRKGGR